VLDTDTRFLSEGQLARYREDGYLLVKGLLGRDEAAGYRAELHAMGQRLASTGAADPTWGSARGVTDVPTVLQGWHDVQFYSGAFSRLITDDRLTGVAAALMGTPNVQLHHTKVFIKPPENGSPFPMHQDYPFFPHSDHSVLAAIVHLDDAPDEKGCVRVVPGSHRLGPLEHLQEGLSHLPRDRFPIESAVPVEAEAGDVLFFGYLTVHGSGVNVSSEARTTLLVQMRDPQDKPTEDLHPSRGQGMMLRGIDPDARV